MFPSPGFVPPIRMPLEALKKLKFPPFVMGAVPAASTPIRLPMITIAVAGPRLTWKAPSLPEITFPSPTDVPPTVISDAFDIRMPSSCSVTAAVPAALVPM